MRKVWMIAALALVCLIPAFGLVSGAENRRGDINGDGAFDIHDLLAELAWMRSNEAAPAAADLDGNGRVNVFDLLAMLRQMSWLRKSDNEEFRAVATINQHTIDEQYVFNYYPVERRGGVYAGHTYYGPLSSDYKVYANRIIERVEFILEGDTLREMSGITPALVVKDSAGQGDTVLHMLDDEFVVSEQKSWLLKVWNTTGEMYLDSGQSRFAIVNDFCVDCGGSPNVGLPLEFPLVLRGPWQRFALELPWFEQPEPLLNIDLNPEGADSVVFENVDQLSESIMKQVVINLPVWDREKYTFSSYGPLASGAVSVHSDIKTVRLLFYFYVFANGGYVSLVPLDGNERLLNALGFPRWRREAGYGILNNNYKKDPVIFEKYKDQID